MKCFVFTLFIYLFLPLVSVNLKIAKMATNFELKLYKKKLHFLFLFCFVLIV